MGVSYSCVLSEPRQQLQRRFGRSLSPDCAHVNLWPFRLCDPGHIGMVGLIGAICVSLALRNIFRIRYWWAGILVLSVIPAWFHHSRTGYEMPTFVSFYSSMLYCYWMYRFHKPVYLYPAILFSRLHFTIIRPGRPLIPLTIVALLVLDFPYHLRMRNSTLGAAGLGILCVVPYIRFQISHAGNSAEVLSHVGSYWVQDLPITGKNLAHFWGITCFISARFTGYSSI